MSGVEPTTDVAMKASLFASVLMLAGDIVVHGGTKTTFSATGSPLEIEPIGVAAHLEVPPAGVNMRHVFALGLETSAGIPVPWSHRPLTAIGGTRLLLEAAVDVFAPVRSGQAPLAVPWCTNLHHVEVPEAGRYRLVLSVGDVDTRRLDFDVVDMNP